MSDVDVDAELARHGCAQPFEALQLCLADNDRDWGKCQTLVREWKTCMSKEKKEGKQR